MTAIARVRARIARHRYPAAALATCLVFGIMELTTSWAAGAGRAGTGTPLGRLAYQCASLFTPAASLLRAGSDRQVLAFQLFMGGQLLLVLAFSCLLWWRIVPGRGRSGAFDKVLPGALLVTALALGSLAFCVVMAAALAALLPPRRALAWLAALTLLGLCIDGWLLLDGAGSSNDAAIRAMFTVLALDRCMPLLGAAFAWLARREWQARTGLATANAQLRATQSLLADTVRSAERLRIARDLHDAVGHHLTALKLHLDLATRQCASGPPAALATAHELTHSLLAEVRGVVSAERQEARVNLRAALELLCTGIPHPAIRLQVDSAVEDCPPATAHALLSCVQEAITNTVRHAGAALLTIDIYCDGHSVEVRIADDGRGARGAPEGNGLSGMRERLTELGGTLAAGDGVRPGARRGYALQCTLPLAGARA